MALLTWAAAFPLLTAVNVLLGPLLAALPLPGRTLLMTGILIGLLTYGIMPPLTRLTYTWLSPWDNHGGQGEEAPILETSRRVHRLTLHNFKCKTPS
jgi:antibiotic biosynthesis monooxygenase (ABM) superfamily enzyme